VSGIAAMGIMSIIRLWSLKMHPYACAKNTAPKPVIDFDIQVILQLILRRPWYAVQLKHWDNVGNR
jgi:hypothetical protein